MTAQVLTRHKFESWDRARHWMPTGATPVDATFRMSVHSWYYHQRAVPQGTSGGDAREAVVNNLDPRNPRKVAGMISGIFRIEGVRIHNGKVVLLDRKSGEFLSSTLTDEEGYYCFRHLDLDFNHYVVVAIDPNDVERAEAHDRIYPL